MSSVETELSKVRTLAKAWRYDEARAILAALDHPTAQKWLAQLDHVAPRPTHRPSRGPISDIAPVSSTDHATDALSLAQQRAILQSHLGEVFARKMADGIAQTGLGIIFLIVFGTPSFIFFATLSPNDSAQWIAAMGILLFAAFLSFLAIIFHPRSKLTITAEQPLTVQGDMELPRICRLAAQLPRRTRSRPYSAAVGVSDSQ